MKRVRNDTYFQVLSETRIVALGKRVIQVECIPNEKGLFLAEVMYEKV
jgi:hypothetical protein